MAQAARAHCPLLVVDDGSTSPIPQLPGCEVLRLPGHAGKGAALRAGFQWAEAAGFAQVITMDADGQHFATDLPKFLAHVQTAPGSLAVGVRNFSAAGCPCLRRYSNAISTFWFYIVSGIRLGDTQCGFRAYPLAVVEKLQPRAGRYAFELEFLVRAAWLGTPITAVPVQCSYASGTAGISHFRPVRDFVHIAVVMSRLVLQCWFVPRTVRAEWSLGRKTSWRSAVREFFTAQPP